MREMSQEKKRLSKNKFSAVRFFRTAVFYAGNFFTVQKNKKPSFCSALQTDFKKFRLFLRLHQNEFGNFLNLCLLFFGNGGKNLCLPSFLCRLLNLKKYLKSPLSKCFLRHNITVRRHCGRSAVKDGACFCLMPHK